MSAEAELLITPDISRQALQRSMAAMDQAMKQVAKQAERDLEDAIADGMKGGAKRGGRAVRNALKQGMAGAGRAWDSTSGARAALGGTIFGAAMAGLFEAINRAEQGAGMIGGLLGESTAAEDLTVGQSVGLTDTQNAQLRLNLAKVGFTDNASLNDALLALNERLTEQAMTGEGDLSQFAKFDPSERIGAVLATLGNLDPQQQAMWLNRLELGDEVVKSTLAMLQDQKRRVGERKMTAEDVLGGTGTGVGMTITGPNLPKDYTFEAEGTPASQEAVKAAASMVQEAAKADELRSRQATQDLEIRQQQIAAIGQGEIGAYLADRQRQGNEQRQMIETFQANLTTANEAREATKAVMDELVSGTNKLVAEVSSIAAVIRSANPAEAAAKAVVDGAIDGIPGSWKEFFTGRKD